MKCNRMECLAALAGLALFVPGVSSSQVVQVPWMQVDGQFRGALTAGNPLGAELTAPGDVEEEQELMVVAARFSIPTTLPSGIEIEIWPIAVDGVSADSTFGRNLWITDDRTAGFAVFDITRISRAWDSGALENHGLLLHVVEEIPEGQQAVNWNNAPNLWGIPTLTLHRIELDPEEAKAVASEIRNRSRDAKRVTQEGASGPR